MSTRKEYKLELKLTVSLDDESIDSVTEILSARVNEMCSALERKDDVRIILLHYCNVTENN